MQFQKPFLLEQLIHQDNYLMDSAQFYIQPALGVSLPQHMLQQKILETLCVKRFVSIYLQ